MKPQLIFVKENDGMVTISVEDIKRIVDSVYEAGRADGLVISKTQYLELKPTWTTKDMSLKKTDVIC